MRRLQHWLVPIAALAAVALTGCNTGLTDVEPAGPTILVVSDTWLTSQGPGESQAAARQRIATLRAAIAELRKETGTGWVGRQDDVTGYLSDLSGGSRPGDAADLMDGYGPELFGVDSSNLRLDEPERVVPGMVTTRARQTVGDVSVLDAVLVFTAREGNAGSDDDRVTGISGRVFPGLEVGTEPTLPARKAARIAERQSRGHVEGDVSLVVVPDGPGILTWKVSVLMAPGGDESEGPTTADYYVDAHTGDVVAVRGTSIAEATYQLVEPDPNSVPVTGTDPAGKQLSAYGLRVPEGVALVDTTTPAWDQASRRGGVETYDATGLDKVTDLPGRMITSADNVIRDPDAIAAHAYVRAVLDYYAELGRNSWDGQGGTAVASVNYGPDDFCNAMFFWALDPPQMLFGNPCVVNGTVMSTNSVYPDVAGHELTHGVTSTSAGLIYAGQSGALSESFSDYFGNVVGNRINGVESTAYGEDRCVGITTPNPLCRPNPDGSMSLRYLLNGNTFEDYARIMHFGRRLYLLQLGDQDEGGVHQNSAIWNNALWTIRTQLSKIDNLPGNQSPLARAFDQAVFGALVTRLGPTAGFVDARAAVEQVIIDSRLDPVVLRVAQETFDANQICTGCASFGEPAGEPVVTDPRTQLKPTVSGDSVAWLDLTAGQFVGAAAQTSLGGAPRTVGGNDAVDVTMAGQATVLLTRALEVVRHDPAGGATALGRSRDGLGIVARGLAGSDAGAAWAEAANLLSFVNPIGTVTSAEVPGLNGDTVISVGTGGGTVAAGTDGGRVFLWPPGGPVTEVGKVSGAVATVAAYGSNVLAVYCPPNASKKSAVCPAKVFTGDGRVFDVSSKASVFGAAMSEEYAVWPEATGIVQAGAATSEYPETDLYVLSLRTGKIYDLMPAGGQQGFPSLSGRRLVWQDAGSGGDDIRTRLLPEGL